LRAAAAALATVVALGTGAPARAEALSWSSAPAASRVGFLLHTFWHGVEGTTTAVTATMTSDSGDPLADGHVVVRVDAASLSTGINRRDAKMRDVYLETAKHPEISFLSTSPPRKALEEQSPEAGAVWVAVEGDFTLHGITRPLTANVEALREGDGWMMKAHFSVLLSEFGIADPSILLNKVDDAVDVYFEIKLSAGGSSGGAESAPGGERDETSR